MLIANVHLSDFFKANWYILRLEHEPEADVTKSVELRIISESKQFISVCEHNNNNSASPTDVHFDFFFIIFESIAKGNEKKLK